MLGVQLDDGTELAAATVASSIDPHWTFERLLSPDELPEEFAQAVSRIDYSSASAKINLALSEPPRMISPSVSSGSASRGKPTRFSAKSGCAPIA